MHSIYLGIVVFLLLLAVFDVMVGVSNDAVNFINAAIGSKAAKFRTILLVAAIGVFAGAAVSNGMMDIARHGIFAPQYFTFSEVMCIFLAVMVTDVVILDLFNTLGMPTSTTVSMVFELLGGAFALSVIKVATQETLSLGMLLNTDKALQVILAIFLSVAIAFVVGWLVQRLARLLFTFTFNKRQPLRQSLFAGLSLTAIVYFLLINGLKGSALMTPALKAAIADHTGAILLVCIVGFTLLMFVLALCRVNVFRVVVLSGTFALAMAFAGNDLVNFLGVPLAGLSAYLDFSAAGGTPDAFLMESLAESARTPWYLLTLAGMLMVISLVTSKKAQNVVKTSVDLSRQDEGDEMFGSSMMARSLVRSSLQVSRGVEAVTPTRLQQWVNSRFNAQDAVLEPGAAFDLLRASINVVIAGLLVALGTSLKLPLSTTYVTFMVAMGSSLADRAWTRESAVFRVTGVLSVIGGWFITAGAAFCLCFLVAMLMHFGGFIIMLVFIVLAISLLVRSHIRFAKKEHRKDELEEIFQQIVASRGDRAETQRLVARHNRCSNIESVDFVRDLFVQITDAFFGEKYRVLLRAQGQVNDQRRRWKRIRKREIIGMRRIDPRVAMEQNTWFFLGSNAVEQMLYGLKRIAAPFAEHLGNNFTPLDPARQAEFLAVRGKMTALFGQVITMLQSGDMAMAQPIRDEGKRLQKEISALRKRQLDTLTLDDQDAGMRNADFLYINLLQESQELLSALRHLVRGVMKMNEKER